MDSTSLGNTYSKSRYLSLQICFEAYAKIQILSKLMPHYNNVHDIMYLRFSIQSLKERNSEYLNKVKELSDLEISSPFNYKSSDSILAKSFEAIQIRKAELANEVNALNYKYPGFSFSLEESTYLFDFFEKLNI
jgi:hypothetical protein